MVDQKLSEAVYQQIKQMLLTFEITAGQKVVASDLAERLGVSRTPINIALYLLAKQGFLEPGQKQGYVVHQLTREEMDSLYDMREIFELAAVEKAIEHVNEEKLAAIAQKEQTFSKAIAEGMGRERFLLDQDFHVGIIELSGNLYMPEHYREIYQKIFLRHRITPLRGERTIHAPAEHHEIFEALRLRDVVRAKQAVSAHIQAGREYIYSFMF